MDYTEKYGWANLMGEDMAVDYFYAKFDSAEEYNYVRDKLSHAIPELAGLMYEPGRTLVEQLAELKGVPVSKVEQVLELESYRSYLYNKTYQETIDIIGNSAIPLSEKEKIVGRPLGLIMFVRAFKSWMIALPIMIVATLVFYFIFQKFLWMWLVSFGLIINGIPWFTKLRNWFVEKIFNIATGGGD